MLGVSGSKVRLAQAPLDVRGQAFFDENCSSSAPSKKQLQVPSAEVQLSSEGSFSPCSWEYFGMVELCGTIRSEEWWTRSLRLLRDLAKWCLRGF